MEENKKLVISYRYCVEKISDEEKEIGEEIQELFNREPTDEVVTQLVELMGKKESLLDSRRVTVRKEYPEFLVKNFKNKEDLYDFIDEDEPNVLMELEIFFESVPDCLKNIGFVGTYKECRECVHYIEKKHGYGEDD